eukprot:jgi/Bigna1/138660/aug1.46_g13368
MSLVKQGDIEFFFPDLYKLRDNKTAGTERGRIILYDIKITKLSSRICAILSIRSLSEGLCADLNMNSWQHMKFSLLVAEIKQVEIKDPGIFADGVRRKRQFYKEGYNKDTNFSLIGLSQEQADAEIAADALAALMGDTAPTPLPKQMAPPPARAIANKRKSQKNSGGKRKNNRLRALSPHLEAVSCKAALELRDARTHDLKAIQENFYKGVHEGKHTAFSPDRSIQIVKGPLLVGKRSENICLSKRSSGNGYLTLLVPQPQLESLVFCGNAYVSCNGKWSAFWCFIVFISQKEVELRLCSSKELPLRSEEVFISIARRLPAPSAREGAHVGGGGSGVPAFSQRFDASTFLALLVRDTPMLLHLLNMYQLMIQQKSLKDGNQVNGESGSSSTHQQSIKSARKPPINSQYQRVRSGRQGNPETVMGTNKSSNINGHSRQQQQQQQHYHYQQQQQLRSTNEETKNGRKRKRTAAHNKTNPPPPVPSVRRQKRRSAIAAREVGVVKTPFFQMKHVNKARRNVPRVNKTFASCRAYYYCYTQDI